MAREHVVGFSASMALARSIVVCQSRHCLLVILLVVTSGLLVGCGERRYPVSGKITYGDGTPYTGRGAVALEKGSGKDQVMVRAVIQEDGTFSTAGGSPGAWAGQYRVRLIPPPPEVPEPPPDEVNNPKPRPIPPPKPIEFADKFLRFESSGLEVKVEAGASSLDINIGDPPKR